MTCQRVVHDRRELVDVGPGAGGERRAVLLRRPVGRFTLLRGRGDLREPRIAKKAPVTFDEDRAGVQRAVAGPGRVQGVQREARRRGRGEGTRRGEPVRRGAAGPEHLGPR
jgi:hypothetical protein